MFGKHEKSPEEFWREYEAKTGEKVLAHSLGQYISGWEEFDRNGWNAIWGLIIATAKNAVTDAAGADSNSARSGGVSPGGFRFHHFPHAGWLEALSRLSSGAEPPKEKTIFIPRDRIISARLVKETKWWKKILCPSVPKLVICYRGGAGTERQLLLEAEYKSEEVAERLANAG
jgi:hypothetical protein